ncbi:hypothetical protein TNCV_1609221 [Trichonephila clavipes]|nr:hypothetical protein TNCV_1609221 [Trichonephila clavipes]
MERRNDGGTCAAPRCSVQDTLNQYNAHVWASENSHRTQSRADQQRFQSMLGTAFLRLPSLPRTFCPVL